MTAPPTPASAARSAFSAAATATAATGWRVGDIDVAGSAFGVAGEDAGYVQQDVRDGGKLAFRLGRHIGRRDGGRSAGEICERSFNVNGMHQSGKQHIVAGLLGCQDPGDVDGEDLHGALRQVERQGCREGGGRSLGEPGGCESLRVRVVEQSLANLERTGSDGSQNIRGYIRSLGGAERGERNPALESGRY